MSVAALLRLLNARLARPLTVAGLAVLCLTACGGGAEPTPVAVVLNAEVCAEGEGPKTKIYLRNLDDYEWRDVTFTLMKNEEPFTRQSPSWLPESQQPAEPFTDALKFESDSDVEAAAGGGTSGGGGGATGVTGPQILRLRFFNNLDSAKVEVNSPQPGEWSGDITKCQ